MSRGEPARVSVRIMEKEYIVACPYEERSALLDAAEFLNGRMREIRDSGKVVGLDRIAVMAALNLAHEFLKTKDRETKLDSGVGTRVARARGRRSGEGSAAGTVRKVVLPLQARHTALV
jgi:cell division protein ZapA